MQFDAPRNKLRKTDCMNWKRFLYKLLNFCWIEWLLDSRFLNEAYLQNVYSLVNQFDQKPRQLAFSKRYLEPCRHSGSALVLPCAINEFISSVPTEELRVFQKSPQFLKQQFWETWKRWEGRRRLFARSKTVQIWRMVWTKTAKMGMMETMTSFT